MLHKFMLGKFGFFAGFPLMAGSNGSQAAITPTCAPVTVRRVGPRHPTVSKPEASFEARHHRDQDDVVAKWIARHRFVLLASEGASVLDHLEWLDVTTRGAVHCDEPEVVREALCGEAADVFLICDVDLFESMADAVQWLTKFRAQSPNVPVLLVSRYFANRATGIDISSIGDGCTKLPASRTSLALAIGPALARRACSRQNKDGDRRNPQGPSRTAA